MQNSTSITPAIFTGIILFTEQSSTNGPKELVAACHPIDEHDEHTMHFFRTRAPNICANPNELCTRVNRIHPHAGIIAKATAY